MAGSTNLPTHFYPPIFHVLPPSGVITPGLRNTGPYIVASRTAMGNYIIKDVEGKIHPRAIPIGQLKHVKSIKGIPSQLIVEKVEEIIADAVKGVLYRCRLKGSEQVRTLEFSQIANPDVITRRLKIAFAKNQVKGVENKIALISSILFSVVRRGQ